MTSEFNSDGNVLGRLGALLLLAAAGFGLHKLNCGDGMCPMMKTDSCCAGEHAKAPASAPAVSPKAAQ
jgi:hypothetical protein